jgi:hypothetical protein
VARLPLSSALETQSPAARARSISVSTRSGVAMRFERIPLSAGCTPVSTAT